MELSIISGAAGRGMFLDLLNRAFAVPAGSRFFDDFPVWDEAVVPSGESIARFGAFTAEGRLVGCTGVRLARLSAPGGLPVALIGAVATEEAYRGQGLASQLVSYATEWAKARGAALALLWGSEHSLYRRLGFELRGTQVMIGIDRLSLRAPKRVLRQGWTPGIFELMMRRSHGLIHTREDERWITAHRNVQWFWTGEGSTPDAYAALGRGIDLSGIVHEWGGEREALHDLLASVRALHPTALLLGSPMVLDFWGIPAQVEDAKREFLALVNVIDPLKVGSFDQLWIWGLDAA